MRLLALTLCLALPATAVAETGAEAFARRDFIAARQLWSEEAAEGSAEAQFGLGALSDLGLGVPRDPARAFRYYLMAADAGHAEAQFNVAIMLDSGTISDSDTASAAVWYSRAAANGHSRAQYNLGLLFEAGDGVDRNLDLARFWQSRAAEELSAASDRLASLGPVDPASAQFVAPTPLGGFRVSVTRPERVDLVWSAPPTDRVDRFLVEIARLPDEVGVSGEIVERIETDASAVNMPLPDQDGQYAWRVLRADAETAEYAAAPWRPLDPEIEEAKLPGGFVRFDVAGIDDDALRLARKLEPTLVGNGYWMRINEVSETAAASSVGFLYQNDADSAADVATFLPVIRRDDARRLAPADIGNAIPGEVVVPLVGGLRDS